jgi:predicted nucleotide-binding protein
MTMPTEHDVFVSYAHNDAFIAGELAQKLKQIGHDVWTHHQIQTGTDWVQETEQALADSRAIVLLLSPDYLNSKWANFETGLALKQFARDRARVLPIVVRDIDPAGLPSPLRRVQTVDGRRLNTDEIAERIHKALERTAA